MNGPEIHVDTQALRRHVSSVDAVAAIVQDVKGAAQQMRLGGAAYGQLCQAFPAMMEPLHNMADRVINEALGSLDESAYALRAAATDYDRQDSAAAGRLRHTS